jgi:hypothetical protein
MTVAIATAARAQRFVALGVTDAKVLTYVQQLQAAVRTGARAQVAAMVHYPLRVNNGAASHQVFATSADLVRKYSEIFTTAVRDAILTQDPAKLSGSPQGIAIKGGAVWLTSVCNRRQPSTCTLGVSAINLRMN